MTRHKKKAVAKATKRKAPKRARPAKKTAPLEVNPTGRQEGNPRYRQLLASERKKHGIPDDFDPTQPQP